MAAALLALLTQQSPNLQTRKGLLITGLQNDFLSPEGKLPISTASGFLDRLQELVPAFREYGDVIWVRSHFQESRKVNHPNAVSDHVIAGDEQSGEEADGPEQSPAPPKKARTSKEATDQPVTARDLMDRIESGHPGLTELQDEDEELFLTGTIRREPCCIPGTFGAEYATQIKDLVDPVKDIEVLKTFYSAFGSTSLLLTLRSRLITELFICGCITNLSVFATAMDAARYGIKVTLVEDCLGYRRRDRHELAMKQLHEIMEADVAISTEVIKSLRNPPEPPQEVLDEVSYEDEDEDEDEDDDNDDDGVDAVGEDAQASPDLLEADSADEEEDILPIVRSYRSNRPIALRYASSKPTEGLLESAKTGTDPIAPVELTEPSNPRDADASGVADNGSDSTSLEWTGRQREKSENHFDRQLRRSTDGEGVENGPVNDESSRKVISHQPWIGAIIDKSRAQEDKPSPASSGRSTHPGLNAISALVGLDQSVVNNYENMMAEARLKNSLEDKRELQSMPLFGEGMENESGGSRIMFDLLPPEVSETVFAQLNREVTWQKMHHQTGEVPRLVCCQGSIEEGNMPVYRHPSDQTLQIQSWTPSVDIVRKAAEQAVGHTLNHALIQLYRGGTDYISEHSDKTLDVVKGSLIVNVSFGAQRTMRLRTKRSVTTATFAVDATPLSRTTYRVPMPHNSAIMMSLPTNAEYLHGINADKRPSVELTDAEKAYGGQRISLTFRNIGTFLNEDSSRIWGQGAVARTKDQANTVINADAIESERLVRAFGSENQSSTVDWDAIYGNGFDVLHLK